MPGEDFSLERLGKAPPNELDACWVESGRITRCVEPAAAALRRSRARNTGRALVDRWHYYAMTVQKIGWCTGRRHD